jgi:hypothetical protein
MKRLMISAIAFAALANTPLEARPLAPLTYNFVRVHFDLAVKVANQNLPAGDYTITVLRAIGDERVLRFQSDTGTSGVAVAFRDLRPSDQQALKTDVVLRREGSVARVNRIEIEGSASDLVFPPAAS